MTRLMLLDRGEELSNANAAVCRAASAPIRLKLIGALPPFREPDVLHVRGVDGGRGSPGRLLLCRDDARFTLRPGTERPRSGLDVIGTIVALERRGAVVATDRGLGRLLPVRYWPAAARALEVLRRFRHPLTPPLFHGPVDTLLAGVRDKYNGPIEAAQYNALATGDVQPFERDLLDKHVAPGARILDVGCGGGREAIGMARLGYRVVAIDIAPRMVEAARRSAEQFGVMIDFRVQSATTLDEPTGAYDAAFFSGSIHHIPGRRLRIETLARIRRALTRDGVLILMAIYRQPLGLISRTRLVDTLRRLGRALGGTRILSEPGDGYMREVSDGGDPERPCFFHEYDGPVAVADELEAAGFTAREVSECWWVCRPVSPPLC